MRGIEQSVGVFAVIVWVLSVMLSPSLAAQGEEPPRWRPTPVRELLKLKPQNIFDDDWACAVCDAITEKDQAKLAQLVNSGFDVNTQGVCGFSVLAWALFTDNLEAFKWLLENGADPDLRVTEDVTVGYPQRVRAGDSLLIVCLKCYRADYFHIAVKKTKDINQRDAAGNSLLYRYGIFGEAPPKHVLDWMIDHGMDLNLVGDEGITVAYRALAWGSASSCLIYLKAGVDPGIVTNKGFTVQDLLESKIVRHIDSQRFWDRSLALQRWLDEHEG
ncbi:ankyrin repeat domain-containing protein [Roseimaritima sediminicola]|uniref:ankyrin repeat domain-containing protein n=1 Tax=Roseimaritima sediminicola TaxID=2662066 RepID=UPI00129855C0|nr:hypothetical protein [Roseimaritima sediminicola]